MDTKEGLAIGRNLSNWATLKTSDTDLKADEFRSCCRTADGCFSMSTSLPYKDTKPQGAADFYFAINATFRFLLARLGREGWESYLKALGRGYYEPVNANWRQGGLPAVAQYWRDFFAAEPGSEVEVREAGDRVEIDVRQCPAIKHLREGGRDIVREYCQHCQILGSARAEASGLKMRLKGGNGSCVHTYALPTAALPEQDMAQIREAGS